MKRRNFLAAAAVAAITPATIFAKQNSKISMKAKASSVLRIYLDNDNKNHFVTAATFRTDDINKDIQNTINHYKIGYPNQEYFVYHVEYDNGEHSVVVLQKQYRCALVQRKDSRY